MEGRDGLQAVMRPEPQAVLADTLQAGKLGELTCSLSLETEMLGGREYIIKTVTTGAGYCASS